jgi:hypothetical protein
MTPQENSTSNDQVVGPSRWSRWVGAAAAILLVVAGVALVATRTTDTDSAGDRGTATAESGATTESQGTSTALPSCCYPLPAAETP